MRNYTQLKQQMFFFFLQSEFGTPGQTITSNPMLQKFCFRNLLMLIPQRGQLFTNLSVPNKAEALFNDLSTVPQQDHMNIPSQSWLSKRCNFPVRANLTSILSSLVHKLPFSSKMYEFKASWGVQLIDRDRNVFIYLWGVNNSFNKDKAEQFD